MQIGKRIKELRETHKITLTRLSKDSGVQIATLSRIENGKMTGTLESHMNIARALGVDITRLYHGITKEPSPPAPTTEESLLESFTYNEKSSYEILANNILRKKMMPIVLRIDPGGATNPEQNKIGSEKFIFVLSGQVKARVADQEFSLSKNKTLYFDASQKHHFENDGKETTKVIVVVTPVAL